MRLELKAKLRAYSRIPYYNGVEDIHDDPTLDPTQHYVRTDKKWVLLNPFIDNAVGEERELREEADRQLSLRIDNESRERMAADSELARRIALEEETRLREDNILQEGITSNTGEINTLRSDFTHHIENLNNPHKVTVELIGAVSHLEYSHKLGEVDNSINLIQQKNIRQDERLSQLEDKTDDLNGNCVHIEGDQTINGSLNITKERGESGNLTVWGDLLVKGKTTTLETETLLVKDNIVVLNSLATELQTPSGIVIKVRDDTPEDLDDSTYAIAFDPDINAVVLGNGYLDKVTNEFRFDTGEANPVMVRKADDQLLDHNPLYWDKVSRRAYTGERLNLRNGNVRDSLVLENCLVQEAQSLVGKVALGRFNKELVDTMLEIGNGENPSKRSNAFMVYGDGRAMVQTKPKNNEDVVRLLEILMTDEQLDLIFNENVL